MRQAQFNKLIATTKIGRSGQGEGTLEALRLHFVKGISSPTECARLAGISRQSAERAIKNLKAHIEAQGLVAVTVMVPKGQQSAIEKAAQLLRQQTSAP